MSETHPSETHPVQTPQTASRQTEPGLTQPATHLTQTQPFRPVSPTYVWVRVLSLLPWTIVVLIGLAVLAFFIPVWIPIVAAVLVLAGTGLLIWLIRRQVSALGYQERPTDLLIRRGIMFQSTTVVPYGRMQFVDVVSGPILRAFGLATVTLNTASAATDATVPGLPKEEADHLRELLAARGQSALSGL